MSIPLNTLTTNAITISNLAEARQWIDSFPRPVGFSPYAWSSTKRIALEVWKSFFNGKRFQRTPEGFPILKEKSIRGMC